MADCERISNCDFFNDRLKQMPATANMFKRQYCYGNQDNCARNRVLTFLVDKDHEIDNDLAAEICRVMASLAPNEQWKAKRFCS